MYRILWHDNILKDFKIIGINEAKKIRQKVEGHLVKNPYNLGKLLTGQYKGLYRYRIGDYRVIYFIEQENLLGKIVLVAHRKDVYSK